MFCDNASYQTQKMAKNCVNYCTGQKDNRLPSYQDLHTEQSQRNPSNYYHTIHTQRDQRLKTQKLQQNNLKQIHQMEALEVMHEHTKRENEQLKAITRNKKIAAILSTIIAFSQRIEGIKQKLAGYPAESFSPVEFFNVLDLTEKGYVDLYDVKRFVNNEKITQKDILSLFKKVNGDHSKDNSRLSYFGYLNLIKPYFNEHLARDLLLRDSNKTVKKHRQQQSLNSLDKRNDFDIIQPTQQSVLLLFQQLMLLQCICVSEHEQGKQQLMGEYMLNVIEIKQIIGLDNNKISSQSIENAHQKRSSPSSIASLYTNNKSPLKILYDFIENNSQFEIDFKEMKFILAFLINAHQSQLVSQKYLSLLFIPMNCKQQLMRHFLLEEEKGQSLGGNNNRNKKIAMENYMNTYLTRDNLINKGNIQPIREYFRAQNINNGNNYYGHQYQQQRGMNSLTQNHMNVTTSSSSKNKMNFLQFVHPKSLQRMMGAGDRYNSDNNFLSEQQLIMQQPYNYVISQHPQMQQINASNKYLLLGQNINKRSNKNINILYQQQQQRQHYLSNNPSLTRSNNNNNNIIPQQNIIINVPKESLERRQYPMYQQQQQYLNNNNNINNNYDNNASIISHTPFLQKFMKNDNHNHNNHKGKKISNQQQSQQQDYSINNGDSKISDSAFEVIDYGYQINNYQQQQRPNNYDNNNNNKKYQQYPNNNKINDQSQKYKKQTLDSRYNLVISQYKNSQLYPNNNNNNNNNNNKQNNTINNILQPSISKVHNNNYILDSVALSQSNMMMANSNNNQSNFMNKFYSNNNNNNSVIGGGNILNEFLKKQ